MRIPLLTAIPADLFAGRHFGAILGFANGGGGLGGFVGPFLAGYLFDRTGDYELAFAVSALAILGSAVAVWVAAPRNAEAFRQPQQTDTWFLVNRRRRFIAGFASESCF
jgi:nitrate/nitrite transporter NarK